MIGDSNEQILRNRLYPRHHGRDQCVGGDLSGARSKLAFTKVATLKMGTTVDVVELVGNGAWAHVKVAGQTGYIRADLLK